MIFGIVYVLIMIVFFVVCCAIKESTRKYPLVDDGGLIFIGGFFWPLTIVSVICCGIFNALHNTCWWVARKIVVINQRKLKHRDLL